MLEKRKYSGDQLRWLVRQALGQAPESAAVAVSSADETTAAQNDET